MQKKTLLFFVTVTAILFSGFVSRVFADTGIATSSINAEILSTVWYSTTTINENDNISIYAGFQNHSAENLSGTAAFFVDDAQISKMNFVASPKTLIKLGADYNAVRGNHTAQVKIVDIAEVGGSSIDKLSVENLLAKESEKSNFSVSYKVTEKEIINNLGNTASNIVNAMDAQSGKLADYVESLKQSATTSNDSLNSLLNLAKSKIVGQVLGTSTENDANAQAGGQNSEKGNNFSFYNFFLDALAYIIRHWVWTLSVVLIVVLYISFK